MLLLPCFMTLFAALEGFASFRGRPTRVILIGLVAESVEDDQAVLRNRTEGGGGW